MVKYRQNALLFFLVFLLVSLLYIAYFIHSVSSGSGCHTILFAHSHVVCIVSAHLGAHLVAFFCESAFEVKKTIALAFPLALAL